MKDRPNTPPKAPPPSKPPSWRHLLWVFILWIVLLYIFNIFNPFRSTTREISYSEFKTYVRNGSIGEITMKGNQISGKLRDPGNGTTVSEESGQESDPYTQFSTTKPAVEDPGLIELLEQNNVIIRAKSEEQSWLMVLVVNLLPWLLIIGFFVYSSRKFQERMGGSGGLFGFGKSRAKLFTKSSSNVTFADVAGLDNAKKELLEIVEFLKEPSKFTALGGTLPKGVLLVGPPGVGKTLMARATAGEADVPFFSISGSEFIEMFVGVGASRVRDMFTTAKKKSPAIIFIDEIDSIGRVRGTGLGGGHDEREQTLNQILSEMDGFSEHESLVVMAATNRPDVLDPALIRPGRFDRQITLDLPQKEARRKILEIHIQKVPIDDVNLETIANRTVGLSGADLKNLVNEAALLAARKGKKKVNHEDFDQARDKILLGLVREDRVSDEEKKTVAYHEAGHALVAKLLPGADPLEKVTIIPRGQALGATEQIPEEDRHNLTRSYLLNRIAILLGGRTAEKLVFNDISTGAANDLKNATLLARRMVCQWGMSERLGAVTFRQGEAHPFLGREITEPKDFSEHTAQLIDEEVRRIVDEMEQRATELLKTNQKNLDTLAANLLERETLYKEDINRLLKISPQ
jgi:cell division protease FtsH